MVARLDKYLIADIAVGHLLTVDEMWSPFPWARQAFADGELMTFHTKRDAQRFVAKLKERGCFTQPIAASQVPWTKSIEFDETGASDIDWPSIKDIIQQVLEIAVEHDDKIRDAATSGGNTFEEFLAAAIMMLIQESIESS